MQPVPVPISKIRTPEFFLKIFTTFSTISSVSGLGIKVFLSTRKFLLQNSFSFNIYAIGSLKDLLVISFLKFLIVPKETF